MIARLLILGVLTLVSLVCVYFHIIDLAIYLLISSLLVNDLLKEVEEERDPSCK